MLSQDLGVQGSPATLESRPSRKIKRRQGYLRHREHYPYAGANIARADLEKFRIYLAWHEVRERETEAVTHTSEQDCQGIDQMRSDDLVSRATQLATLHSTAMLGPSHPDTN